MLVIPLAHVCPLWESGLTILSILAGILICLLFREDGATFVNIVD